MNFECQLTQLIQLRDVDGADVPTWLVLGQVVAVHIDRHLLVDGVYDTAAGTAHPARRRARGATPRSAREAMFDMVRPDDLG